MGLLRPPRRPRKASYSLSLLLLLALTGCCAFSAPPYTGPTSNPHGACFDGGVFHNQNDEERTFGDFLRWRLTRRAEPWPALYLPKPGPPPVPRVGRGELRVTLVGHSTVLIQMDGLNILTDPVWSNRVGPVSWAGPRRRVAPAIRFDDLPPIDLVLISHNHYDHMDLPTLTRLVEVHEPRILTGLGNSAFLESEGIAGAQELDWWGRVALDDGRADGDTISVTAVPAEHFSNRGMCDRNATLWVGFVIEGPAGRVYFAGDTGWGPHFAEIGERFGPLRLALLPIGAYMPRWFMSPVHISPEEAVRAHVAVRASTSVGIHYGSFALGDDTPYDTFRDLRAALRDSPPPRPRFRTLRFGQATPIPDVGAARDDARSRRARAPRALARPLPCLQGAAGP